MLEKAWKRENLVRQGKKIKNLNPSLAAQKFPEFFSVSHYHSLAKQERKVFKNH